MTQVVCAVGFCAHNVGGEMCNAKTIYVSTDNKEEGQHQSQSHCITFLPREQSLTRLSMDNVNYAGMVIHAFHGNSVVHPQVLCKLLNCSYHSGKERCSAEIIEILAPEALSSGGTFCRTYSP